MSSQAETAAAESVGAPARATGADGSISVAGVSHSYGGRRGPVQAIGPLDLDVEPGEFLVLVGASGCGKSTLLRLIGGFERPTEGTLTVSGTVPVPGVGAGVRAGVGRGVGDGVVRGAH